MKFFIIYYKKPIFNNRKIKFVISKNKINKNKLIKKFD